MKVLQVKNFEKFQHYKDRRPPWIKFYVAVLDDHSFLALSEQQQRHLMFLWQLAAIHDNAIPFDMRYIRQAIRAKGPVDINGMIAVGWLVVREQDASTVASKDASAPLASPLAERKQDASPRARPPARGETETETETEHHLSTARGDFPERFRLEIPQPDHQFVRALLSRVSFAAPWIAEMTTALEGGMHHPKITGTQLGKVVRQFMGNNNGEPLNMAYFVGHIGREARGEKAPPRRGRDKIADGVESVGNWLAKKEVV